MKSEKKPKADPITDKPIPHGYALVPDGTTGRYFAVHMENLYCEKYEHLEPSNRSSYPAIQIQRIIIDMERRHRSKKWGA